jgi:hypothetical protein
MSQFISSYTNENNYEKKSNMKFHFDIFKHEWMFHILPSIHLYSESHSPYSHGRFWKDGISGLYLSFQWGKWLLTLGLSKKL